MKHEVLSYAELMSHATAKLGAATHMAVKDIDEHDIFLQGVWGTEREMEWHCICRNEDDTRSPACTIGLQPCCCLANI